jgi:hypothetical protein
MTVHAAAATIIGKQANNAILAFILGLLSHFVLDMLPHGDERLGKQFFGHKLKILQDRGELKFLALYGSADSIFLSFFILWLFRSFEFVNSNVVVWAIVGGIIPDLISVTYKLTNSRLLKWFNNIHIINHKYLVEKLDWDWPLKYAIVMQLVVMTGLIWIIYIT